MAEKGREEKGREEKGREEKGREEKDREVKRPGEKGKAGVKNEGKMEESQD